MRRIVDWAVLLVVALVVAAVAGVLLLPRRKQWNADGEADERRASLAARSDADGDEQAERQERGDRA